MSDDITPPTRPLFKKEKEPEVLAAPPALSLPDDAAPSISRDLSPEAAAALAKTTNRRDDFTAKISETPVALDPAANVREKAAARVMEDDKTRFIFMSRYPKLTTYVPRAGLIDIKVEFKNGVFMTEDVSIAAGLRMHPRFGSLYREEKDIKTAAVRAEAARQRESMRAPTFAGSTTSVDGAEQVFFGADRTLSQIEQRAIDAGSTQE